MYLSKPKISFTLAWTRDVVEERGWRYEVWSEPPQAELGNLASSSRSTNLWLPELRIRLRFSTAGAPTPACAASLTG